MGIQVRTIITKEAPLVLVPGASRRQVRYAGDEEYRTRAKDASRRSYRRRTGLELASCLYSLTFIDKAAKESVCFYGNKKITCSVLSVPKTADMLQHLYQTVWRWIDNGIIPAPVLKVQMPKKRYPVFHVDEVRILVEEIGGHEEQLAYLRKDHHDVRARIEQRILAFRKTLKTMR